MLSNGVCGVSETYPSLNELTVNQPQPMKILSLFFVFAHATLLVWSLSNLVVCLTANPETTAIEAMAWMGLTGWGFTFLLDNIVNFVKEKIK